MRAWFSRMAAQTATLMGHYLAFVLALIVCVVWAISGPFFGFSDTWQLVINTGTTVLTFLMVFLIQNAQNRDARAIQLKLDELIRAVDAASNRLIDVEETTDDELDTLKDGYRHQAEQLRPVDALPVEGGGSTSNAAV
jgi:low affinity Fe/Cu permease